MKPVFAFIFSLLVCVTASSQNVDYNRIILPEGVRDIELEEKLVQLAWKNHPSNKVLYNNLAIAQYETKVASSEWLNTIRISGNLNEFNINDSDNIRSQFFPRYNIGVIIPLGLFVGTPAQVKRGKQLEEVAQHNINTQKLAIRATVLKLYNEYLMYRDVFNIRTQELEETSTSFQVLEQRFKAGQELFERYSAGLTLMNQVKVARVEAQTNYLNSKLSLEEYIGVRLEDVK